MQIKVYVGVKQDGKVKIALGQTVLETTTAQIMAHVNQVHVYAQMNGKTQTALPQLAQSLIIVQNMGLVLKTTKEKESVTALNIEVEITVRLPILPIVQNTIIAQVMVYVNRVLASVQVNEKTQTALPQLVQSLIIVQNMGIA